MPYVKEHYSVYVLELTPESGSTKKMKKQNQVDNPLGFLYVGMTGLPVEERIGNHTSGYKSCNLVKKYFTGKIYEQYPEYKQMFEYSVAVIKEKEVAEHLRQMGFCVYQN
jgi:hypothetical protein